MGKKLKVVIAENGTELGKSCEKALKGYGMDVIMCEKDGSLLLEKIGQELRTGFLLVTAFDGDKVVEKPRFEKVEF